MSEPAPEEIVWDCLRGGLRTRALAIVADLGIAQRLADGPRAVEDLARETGGDAETLHRLLRALASDGIFAEGERGTFRNTPASELLLAEGWTDFAPLFGGAWLRAAGELDASGEATFERVFGADFWSWLASHPEERAAFDRAMAQGPEQRLERLRPIAGGGGQN